MLQKIFYFILKYKHDLILTDTEHINNRTYYKYRDKTSDTIIEICSTEISLIHSIKIYEVTEE